MIYWKNDFVLSLFFLFICVATYVTAAGYPEIPGHFPKLLAIVFGIMSLMLMLSALSRRRESGKFFSAIGKFYGPAMISIGVALYALCLKSAGYITSSFVLAIYVILALGYRDKKWMFITAIIAVITIFVAFKILLKVPLPTEFFLPE